MSLNLLTDADVEVLRELIRAQRQGRQTGLPMTSGVGKVHRASDIVMVNVTTEITYRNPLLNPAVDPIPTTDVQVYDVLNNVNAGYTVPIRHLLNVIIPIGRHYAVIDRHGEWTIIIPDGGWYRFKLLQSFATGIANATIRKMDGTDIIASIPLYDPERVFDALGVNDTGYCTFYGGYYYAVQAPCSGGA